MNTKSGGKNGSPKLRKQGLLIRCLERKHRMTDTFYICEKLFKAEEIELYTFTLILNFLALSLSLSLSPCVSELFLQIL